MSRADHLKVIADAGYELRLDTIKVTPQSKLSDWYNGGNFELCKIQKKIEEKPEPKLRYSTEWYSWYYVRNNVLQRVFYFSHGQHNYSCAVPCIGRFSGQNVPSAEVMSACLAIAQEANQRQGYLQAITLSKTDWDKLNKALKLSGFEKRQEMRTKHQGNYKVYVWEWTAEPNDAEAVAMAKKRSEAAKKAWATRRANGQV